MPGNLLTEEERQWLEKLVGEVAEERLRRRARILLLYDDGHATREVAQGAGLSRGRSRYWRRQFQARRVAVFPPDEKSPGLETPLIASSDVGQLSRAATDKLEEEPVLETRPTEAGGLAEFAATAGALLSPGLRSDDPLAEAGRKVWRYHFAQMLLHAQGTLL